MSKATSSMTGDPFLLHRVDASQLQAPVHVINGDIEEHQADEKQGRVLDHLAGPSYLSSVVYWLIAGVVCCVLMLAQVLMGDQL